MEAPKPSLDCLTCPHTTFDVQANVGRLTGRDGQVERYSMDLTVWCRDCGQPFEFIGMIPGLVLDQPSCGWEMKTGRPEARIPIQPAPIPTG